jgi:hypothetical protein
MKRETIAEWLIRNNRDPNIVSTRIIKGKLRVVKNDTAWAEEEIQVIKDNYVDMNYDELAHLLGDRTYHAIRMKIQRMIKKGEIEKIDFRKRRYEQNKEY